MTAKKKNFDAIEVTSRLLNIILDMPVEQQLSLLDRLDLSGYDGSRRYARTHLKKPWIVLVDPENDKIIYDYFIKDISRCGMFIETTRSFSLGQKVTIKFQMPSSQKVFKIMGEIVRFQKNEIIGVGIKFKRQLDENHEI